MNDEKKKMCLNCDGRVSIGTKICPFCGGRFVDDPKAASSVPLSNSEQIKSLSLEETISSLYPPPYRPKVQIPPEEKTEIPQEMAIAQEEEEQAVPKENFFFTTVLFSVGINLTLLGLFLFFFATNGEVVLRWNARYWLLYLLFGSPLAVFALRKFFRKAS